MNFIIGEFKSRIFNGENGYLVAIFKVFEASSDLSGYQNKTITITGYFLDISDGDKFRLEGEIVNHNKYGKQFKVSSYERLKPETKDSLIVFLSSSIFPGIGEKKAANIVEVYQEKSLDIILNQPEDLMLVEGISKKDMDVLHFSLIEYESSYKIILQLNDLGFNPNEALKIYKKTNGKVTKIIDNIYYTYLENIDISFRRLEYLGKLNNYKSDDEIRLKAGLIYAFKTIKFELGHIYLTYEQLKYAFLKYLNIEEDNCFNNTLNNLIKEKYIVKVNDNYYLKEDYDDEELIANRISYLAKKRTKSLNLDKELITLEKEDKITYNDDQNEAIINAVKNAFSIVTGGPGTGKTTIIKAIIKLIQKVNNYRDDELVNNLVLLCPTGRASKRLSEITLFPAMTIHRFLKWNKESNSFSVNEYFKSNVKHIIIDEASMVDSSIMASLFRGIHQNTTVIMVGDYNQLPSVGPGQVLKDLIESNLKNIIRLNTLYRQKENSNIIELAYDINQETVKEKYQKSDLEVIDTDKILPSILTISKNYLNDSYKEFQILVPMYKGMLGIDNLNINLQKIFNPKNKNLKEKMIGEFLYREQDKVLQLINMPEENVYNGDIGIILEINPKYILIDFDGNLVKYNPSDYMNFTLGYAISIHKSQGSEFKTVIIPLSKAYHKMLSKKLYYTAVTRAKSKLYLVGDFSLLDYISRNNDNDRRQTGLKDKINNF